MPDNSWLIPVIIGAVFVVIGLGAIAWGKKEERNYYDSLVTRSDLREFFSQWPFRPEPGSIKIGGWIAMAVGVIVLIIGGVIALVR